MRHRSHLTHLLSLAQPASLLLVWPSSRKSHLPRFYHSVGQRIFQIIRASFDCLLKPNIYCPPTFLTMRYVLIHRVVRLFPAVEVRFTKVAGNIVWVGGRWIVVEPSMGELRYVNTFVSLFPTRTTHLLGRRALMRPFELSGALGVGRSLLCCKMSNTKAGQPIGITLHGIWHSELFSIDIHRSWELLD